MINSTNIDQITDQLKGFLQLGQEDEAVNCVSHLGYQTLKEVLLRAGFTVSSDANKNQLLHRGKLDIRQACKHKVDGYALIGVERSIFPGNREDLLVGGSGENLQIYLRSVNDPDIQERIGQEKLIRGIGPITLASSNSDTVSLSLLLTRGKTFSGKSGEKITGLRYLAKDTDGAIIGAANVTVKKSILGELDPVLSNIYVHPTLRRKGIATFLVSKVREDFPYIKTSSNVTNEGLAFFDAIDKFYAKLHRLNEVEKSRPKPSM